MNESVSECSQALCRSPDGSAVAAGGADTVQGWDVATGTVRRPAVGRHDRSVDGHAQGRCRHIVTAAVLSPTRNLRAGSRR